MTAECIATSHGDSEFVRGEEGPCEWCSRPRCSGKSHAGRCKEFPLPGVNVCNSHGGHLPGVRSKSTKHVLKEQMAKNVFWQEDAPILDPGDALLRIASRLHATAESLSARMDEQIEKSDKAAASGTRECECCGYDPSGFHIDKDLKELWTFAVKESANLMGLVQRIGLAEREVRLQEAQVSLLVMSLSHMMEAMGATEAQQIIGRNALLGKLQELEATHGADGDLEILDAEVVEDLDFLS